MCKLGKSTVLQFMFRQKVRDWKRGDPIPIFMNLAREQNLKSFWKKIHGNFEGLIKVPVILFIDSLDESRMDLRVINKIFFLLSSYSNENPIKMIVSQKKEHFRKVRSLTFHIQRFRPQISDSLTFFLSSQKEEHSILENGYLIK